MKNNKINMIVVCGPTASGKTSLGIKLAHSHNGEIISADSRQVYRFMDLGTGKDLHEYKTEDFEIPYHLIDVVQPNEIYSLYNYIDDFYRVYRDIAGRGKLPVVVGGTGLYIEAVLKHYQVPNVPENIDLRNELMLKSKEELLVILKKYSSDIIDKTDLSSKKRIIRSIEVGEFSLENDVQWGGENPPDFSPKILAVRWPREELIRRIDQRLQDRLDLGMVKEVEELLDKGVSRERMLMFGMEYKYVSIFLLGEISYDKMVEGLKTSIHRLAKRQMTWFRGMEKRGIEVAWVERAGFDLAEEMLGNIL